MKGISPSLSTRHSRQSGQAAFWSQIERHVRTHTPGLVRSWFNDIRARDLHDIELTIVAPEPAQVTYLEHYCRAAFVDAAQSVTGRLITVRFTLDSAGEAAPPASEWAGGAHVLRLSPEFTLDRFVIGPCNRLVHAAAVAAAESPGQSYNPIFVHGGAGLGKSHVLQAICSHALDVAPATRVVCISCESFANLFVDAAQHHTSAELRSLFREADLLVVDDVQYLEGREQAQSELFHTFNALHQSQRQIVVAADRPPEAIPTLEERLISRFRWGLVAELETPCYETRLAILRKKSLQRGLSVPPEVIELIAAEVSRGVRELEGALTRLQGLASTGNVPISIELARQAIGAPVVAPRSIRLEDIAMAVTHHFAIRRSDLAGKNRRRSVTLPRQLAMYLARRLTPLSLDEIGRFFGGRDHTTVLYAERQVESRRRHEAELSGALERIESLLAEHARRPG